MRKCLRCGNEMVEGCGIKVFASNAGITLTDDEDKAFFGRLGSPKVICTPKVGHFWRCIFLCQEKRNLTQSIAQSSK